MKIFVTGATGYIGRAVAAALAKRGHRVVGLTRDAAKAAGLEKDGVEPVIGNMRDYATWARAAEAAELHVHCAVEYGAEYQALDRATVEALLATGRRVLYTSGVWQYGSCAAVPVSEQNAYGGKPLLPWRSEHEELVMMSRGIVIRPGCVYGGSGGLTGLWFSGALEKKAAPVVGTGDNRWAMVQLDDLAGLYALAAEKAKGGELFNGTDGSDAPVKAMAAAASRAAGAGGKIKTLTLAQAQKQYGGLAHGLALDQLIDSSKARKKLGWKPKHKSFAAGAERHFASWKAARRAAA